MPGLLESIRRAVELQDRLDDMYREHERKKRMERVRKLAPGVIEGVLGKYVKLPPREKWEIEPLDEHILAEDEGWLDLCLRVKIDDLEFWVGTSLNEGAIIMIGGGDARPVKSIYIMPLILTGLRPGNSNILWK